MDNREKRGREAGGQRPLVKVTEWTKSGAWHSKVCYVCMAPSGTRNFNVSKSYREKNRKFGWGHGVGLEGGPAPKPCPLTSQVCKRDVQIVYVRNRGTIRKSTSAIMLANSGKITGNFNFLSLLRAFLKFSSASRWSEQKGKNKTGMFLEHWLKPLKAGSSWWRPVQARRDQGTWSQAFVRNNFHANSLWVVSKAHTLSQPWFAYL